MSRFNTGNPIGSISEEDAYDNMTCLDQAMNSTNPTWRDRFGVEKPTIDAALKSAGFMPAGFDFVTGGTLQPGDRNKAVYNPAPNGDNNWYRWNGAFPKEIAANSQPNPKDENNWVPVLIKTGVVEREALRRTYLESGYNLVEGSFEQGGVLVNTNDVLLQERTGKAFSGPAGTVAAGTNPTGGGFTDRSSALLKAKLAANDGSKSVGYRYSDVYGALSRTLSSSDVGRPRPPLGYDATGDVIIGQEQSGLDTDLMQRGGLNIAKKYRGIRRNMTALSVKGGVSSEPEEYDFAPQITGVFNARGLAAYGSLDGVTSYFEGASIPQETWEAVASANYTAATCVIDDAAVTAKILIGDVLKTRHATPCWGIVTGVSGTTITVDEWAINGTTTVTPANGTGLDINPISKVWVMNAILSLQPGCKAERGVMAEFSVQNLAQPNSAKFPNGIDMVMLNSTYGGGAAYLSRGVNNTSSWYYGFNAQGSLFNFHSGSGACSAPIVGFSENSNAVAGIKLNKNNTAFSIAWSGAAIPNDWNVVDMTMALGPRGQALRKFDAYQVISADKQLSSLVPTYLVSVAGGITITMPPKANMQAGHYYKLYFIKAGTFSITGDALVNSAETLSLTVAARSAYTIIYDNNTWHIFS